MLTQASLFAPQSHTGAFLAALMATAAINADLHEKDWCNKAYQYLKAWLHTKLVGHPFMTETVRTQAERSLIVPVPPSKRAWGGIIARAKKEGLIKATGTQKVSNPNAHCANATVWVKM